MSICYGTMSCQYVMTSVSSRDFVVTGSISNIVRIHGYDMTCLGLVWCKMMFWFKKITSEIYNL